MGDRPYALTLARAAFVASIIIFSWLHMQWTHELGHVVAARAGGGTVARVVLDPLTFSRTDVAPNPRPLLTVWGGPIGGVLIGAGGPLLVGVLARSLRPICLIIAAFCLVANGAYVGLGAVQPIADTQVMVDLGTPRWLLALVGVASVGVGRWLIVLGIKRARRHGLWLRPWAATLLLASGATAMAVIGSVWFTG